MKHSGMLHVKVWRQFTSQMNYLQWIAIILFPIGLALGNVDANWTRNGANGRIIFDVSFFLFFLRILHLYKLNRELGPKVLMVGKMVSYFVLHFLICYFILLMGARRGEGESFPPPRNRKIVVEKWCYFPELYKMTEVREEWIENGPKVTFQLIFLYVNFKIFSTNFNSYWFLAKTRKNLPLGCLNSFRIIKDFH